MGYPKNAPRDPKTPGGGPQKASQEANTPWDTPKYTGEPPKPSQGVSKPPRRPQNAPWGPCRASWGWGATPNPVWGGEGNPRETPKTLSGNQTLLRHPKITMGPRSLSQAGGQMLWETPKCPPGPLQTLLEAGSHLKPLLWGKPRCGQGVGGGTRPQNPSQGANSPRTPQNLTVDPQILLEREQNPPWETPNCPPRPCRASWG